MPHISRRIFLAGGSAGSLQLSARNDSSRVDETLRSGIARRKIPVAVGMVADANKTLYAGAFGKRDASGSPVRVDSLFQIASMTKAVTTVAALQLVEQGKVSLAEPVATHLPELANLEVLEGFDAVGKPSLRPARIPVTLHQLLTHTSGFCYDIWDSEMFRYTSSKPANAPPKSGPLMFEPGVRWQYGQGLDWAGRLVEKLSGASLEDYFQQKIFRPLGMEDTSYIVAEAKFDRLVTGYRREANGDLQAEER